ncbi:MAG: hypothetical protein ACI4TF_13765 [Oliverpabstia sp.]
MANTIKVDPVSLTNEVKKLKIFLEEYEKVYKLMKKNIALLELDQKQCQALNTSAEAMYQEFKKMKTYLENGVIEIFETAAVEYKKADNVR